MRAVMRQLPHPVVVVTTLENVRGVTEFEDMTNDKFPRPIPRAMTVSSFTSLSIDPVPRVTFNVTLPSTTYEAIRKCGGFNAHILSGDSHGARVADLFTRGNRPPPPTPTTTASPEVEVEVEIKGRGKDDPDLGVLAGLADLGVQVSGQAAWQAEWEQAGAYGKQVLATVKGGGYIREVPLPPSGTLPLLRGRGITHVLQCKFRPLPLPLTDGAFEHHAIVVGEVTDVVSGESGEGEHGIALAYADRAYRRLGETLLERPPEEMLVQEEEGDVMGPAGVDVVKNSSDNQRAD